MTITDEMIERAAAAALNEYMKDPPAWNRAMPYLKNAWRHIAHAALKAALSGKEEKPEHWTADLPRRHGHD